MTLKTLANRSSLQNATNLWNLVFLFTLLVYAAGLFITIMEPDAAVYAEIAMEMHDSGNWLNIFHKGTDWLDKPHFPFWMSAISYSIFGVSAFAYKLPGVLFVLLGGGYTFLFAKKYYSSMHGWIAALILLTSEHIIISNQDVRAEPFMTGLLIMALYHISALTAAGNSSSRPGPAEADDSRRTRVGQVQSKRRFLHLILGSLALACLIMTKGIFTVIPVGAGIGLTLLYTRNWRSLFHWQWIACIVLTALFLSPSLYAYYQQFDLHPEKTIFGEKNTSGVKFFLWTSQWGRFTNTGPIKGKGDLFFFVHTTLWAFLPWAFLGFYALFLKTKNLIRGRNVSETFTYFGFVTLFLVFSLSRFQLSFYLNPIFPLLAILATDSLLHLGRKALKTLSVIHEVVCCLLVVGVIGLHTFFMSQLPHADTILVGLTALFLATLLFVFGGSYLKKIVFATALLVLGVNYYVNRDFYPALLKYQSESEAAYYVKERGLPIDKLVLTGDIRSVQDIILHRVIPVIPTDSISKDLLSGKYVYTNASGQSIIDSLGLKYAALKTFDDFHVTMLTGRFINKRTRDSAVTKNYLLKME